MSLNELRGELKSFANPEKVKVYQNFHKTGSYGYAEGEEFIGVTGPDIRKVALKNLNLSYKDILALLSSDVHEEKYVAAEIVSGKYNNSSNKKEVFDFYINHADKFSGWDLVDTTASRVAGHFLFNFGKGYPQYKNLLIRLAKSPNIWAKRVSIISTNYFIKNNRFEDTLKISKILLNDKHDLIHKAVGWMLREIGKKDIKVLKKFIKENYKRMPRTTLRYAIERFPEDKRKRYLKGVF